MRFLPAVLLLAVAPCFAQTSVLSWPTGTVFGGGIAYDPIADEIWVIDQTSDNIRQYTSAGAQLNVFPVPTGTLPIGGFVHPTTGNVWVCDEGEIFYEMDRNGVLVSGPFGTTPAITDVSAMTFDPASQTVFISNDSANLIHEFDLMGNAIGGPIDVSAAGSVDADGITYNPITRTFYLGEDTGDQIIEVDRAGALIASWPLTGIASPEGLAIDTRSGILWVTDPVTDTVEAITGIVPAPTGSVVTGGAGCQDPTGFVPAASVSEILQIDRPFSLAVQTGLSAGSPGFAIFILGNGQTQIPLPAPAAGGCDAWTTPQSTFGPYFYNPNGRAGADLSVPNDTGLVGLSFDFQAICFAGSNLFASNSFTAVVQ